MPVRAQRLPAQCRDDVVAESGSLPYGVLRARPGVLPRLGEIRYGGTVTGNPRIVKAFDGQELCRLDASLLVQRKVGVLQHRVGLHTGGPDDRGGVELGSVVELDVPADQAVYPRGQSHLDVARAQLFDGIDTH